MPAGATIETPSSLARAVPWFPVVGAAIGSVGAGVYAGASQVVPPLVDCGQALAVLPAAHALGRAGAAILLAAPAVPAARSTGLGSAWASGLTTTSVAAALVAGGVAAAVSAGAWGVPMLAVAAVGVVVVATVARRTLGGVTGDVMGAAEQAAEILVLLSGSALAAASVPGFPWWR